LYVVIIRENCTSVHKRPWKVLCIGFNHNKRELYINVPEEYVLAYNIIRENCTSVHKRPWGVRLGYNHKKRELYINVPGKFVLAIMVIREICT
jgi:hypothetical protein